MYNITAHRWVGTAGYKHAGSCSIWDQEVRLFSQVILKHLNPALFIHFFLLEEAKHLKTFLSWHDRNVWVWALLCGKPRACKHRLGTGSTHCGHMAARINRRLEAVQSCRQRGFANQSPVWLKDAAHWPFLRPWECRSSLKWLPRAVAAAQVREGSLPALCLCTKHLFHMCFTERRIYLWFNRAFRYHFQMATVASFSYTGFKLKVNEN